MHAFKIIVFSSTNSKIQNDDFNPKLFYVFFVTFSLISLFLLQDNFTVFRDHFQIKLSKNLKKKKRKLLFKFSKSSNPTRFFYSAGKN